MKADSEKVSSGLPAASVFWDVEARGVAHVYAEALLKAAEKEGKTASVLEELSSLADDVCAASPEFEAFLLNPAIGRDRKAEALRKALQGKASDLFLKFLLVLNHHDRLDILRPVALEARFLADEMKGQQEVLVRTAVPMPEDQRQRLIQELKQTIQREPVLVNVVDPEIIGGMTVRVGDWLYDASVRTKINTIRNQLIERSAHEIQSRRDHFCS